MSDLATGSPATASLLRMSTLFLRTLRDDPADAEVPRHRYDEKGLCGPWIVAPADVHVVATGKDSTVFDAAETLIAELAAQGVRVLFDDRRGASPGIKFTDAELIGVPTVVIVGKGLADGVVEVRDRRSDQPREVPVADAAAEVVREVRR